MLRESHGAGEVRGSDGEARTRTLEVARGGVDAKGKHVWTVKDGPGGAAADKPAGEGPDPSNSA